MAHSDPSDYPAVKMFGVYVKSLDISIAWGGQGGTMNMTLIEDPNNNVVLSRNSEGRVFDGIDEDGGTPKVGSAVYFKYQNLYFGGIFQRWSYKESVGGGREYSIVVEAPSKLLDGVAVILNQFNGTTDRDLRINDLQNSISSSAYTTAKTDGTNTVALGNNVDYRDIINVYNVFGSYENFSVGSFGNSLFNEAGMKCTMFFDRLQKLCGDWCATQSGFSGLPNPRGVTLKFGGQMKFGDSAFNLDILEVMKLVANTYGQGYRASGNPTFYKAPPAKHEAYRMKGPVVTANAAIQDITEALQYDYYWAVQHAAPKRNVNGAATEAFNYKDLPNGGGLIPEADIICRLVDKQAPSEPNFIKSYIDTEVPKGKVISYSYGKEQGDNKTQKMVWGGDRQRYYLVNTARALPITGKLGQDKYIIGQHLTSSANAMFNTTSNLIQIGNSYQSAGGSWKTTGFEMRMALAGHEAWENFKCFQTFLGIEPNGYNDIFLTPWGQKVDAVSNILNLLVEGKGNLYTAVMTNLTANGNRVWSQELQNISKRTFDAVKSAAEEFYGQTYFYPLFPAESENYYQMNYVPPDQFERQHAWELADAAYTRWKPTADLKFYDGQARLKAVSCWPLLANADYSALGSDYDFFNLPAFGTAMASTKGQADGALYWFGFRNGYHYVPWKSGAQIRNYDFITTPSFGLTWLVKQAFGINIPPINLIKTGNQALSIPIPPDVLQPTYAGIPCTSTRYRYGPWIAQFEEAGKAEVVADESLRPETFNSYGILQTQGLIQASVGLTPFTENESGQMEVVGAPESNIGERFAEYGPYVTNMKINIDVSGGVKTGYTFSTWTPNFGKLAKYNASRLEAINKNFLQFAKKQRDKIEKRPFPKLKFESIDFKEFAQRMGMNTPDQGVFVGDLLGGAVDQNDLGN